MRAARRRQNPRGVQGRRDDENGYRIGAVTCFSQPELVQAAGCEPSGKSSQGDAWHEEGVRAGHLVMDERSGVI